MSKGEILSALPQLGAEDRAELFQALWSLEGDSTRPSQAEKVLLGREWAHFLSDRDLGAPWSEVRSRLSR